MSTKEELLEKFVNDVLALADIHGEEPVEAALDDELLARQPGEAIVEEANKVLSEDLLSKIYAAGRQILGIPRGAVRGAGRAASGMVAKAVDQDVNISSQDDPLEVKSDALSDLIAQTNKLVQNTNDLLSDLAQAVDQSNKGLSDIDLDMDDLISNISGKSIADVRSAQGTLQVGAANAPDPASPEEELPSPEEEEPRPVAGAR